MPYIGIDPGMKGGIAIIDCAEPQAWRYPGDISECANLLRSLDAQYKIDCAAIEQVHSMPGQGISSCFKFGMNFGAFLGILATLHIPTILVTPRKWQKICLDSGTGETKQRSLNMARRLFPSIDLKFKADDGKADALHIARYAEMMSRK
jgi:Holliday junction resolvasome RuvABC endonuclease subunit